jgi:hypothetical protein
MAAYNIIKKRAERTPVNFIDRPEPAIESVPVPLMETKPHHCRYPLWDDSTSERLCCGATVIDKTSWCEEHLSVVARVI